MIESDRGIKKNKMFVKKVKYHFLAAVHAYLIMIKYEFGHKKGFNLFYN